MVVGLGGGHPGVKVIALAVDEHLGERSDVFDEAVERLACGPGPAQSIAFAGGQVVGVVQEQAGQLVCSRPGRPARLRSVAGTQAADMLAHEGWPRRGSRGRGSRRRAGARWDAVAEPLL